MLAASPRSINSMRCALVYTLCLSALYAPEMFPQLPNQALAVGEPDPGVATKAKRWLDSWF
jgi:hypothetical protein